MKNRAEMLAEKLRPNEVPEKPWQYILVDLITKLLVSKGYDSILVVYDRFSKMSHFVAMTEKIIAEGLTRLFRDNVWKLHELPESVIPVCSRINKEVEQNVGDRNKVIYSISLTDRWTDREDKSGARAVLKNVCQS